jgi:hypothetical protein
MSPTGEQDKTAEPTSDRGLALTQAIADIKRNWRLYRRAYEEKYYGKRQVR